MNDQAAAPAKAYDPKSLVGHLKAQGLDVAEDAAKALINGTFDWLEESAKLSGNIADDVLAKAYPSLRERALEYADQVDGKEG